MAAFILVKNGYKSVMGQQKVIEQQQDNIRVLNEANSIIDIEQATGVAMKEEQDKLSESQSMLQALKSRLGGAVAAWRATEPGIGGRPWAETSAASFSEIDGGSLGYRMHCVEQNSSSSHDLRDPFIGNSSRWERQWDDRLTAPSADPLNLVIDPTQVMMEREAFAAARERARNERFMDQTQLASANDTPEAAQEEEEEERILDDTWWLSEERPAPTDTAAQRRLEQDRLEQRRLESATQAALLNRRSERPQPMLRAARPTYRSERPRAIHQTPVDDIHGIYPEPDLPFRYPKFAGTGQVCPDFEPGFWRKQLEGRGDIWAPKPAPSLGESYKREWDRVEECLSPKSQLPQWTRVPTASFAEAVRRERKREEATPYSPSDAWSKRPCLQYYM
ncbi:hypothetical protein QBC34DRAFT_462863 [Podospora aff. communis PSN243]|uniref:Uncharacterized protein n=1 Tax=Podospora aff. communis PSN243 TaxID=3040156 RepID=A0AAV9GQB4_9PEZI|nr:hypothetical protein QBC34DRAFT_462863 [Podospora aff. communis PSN243]